MSAFKRAVERQLKGVEHFSAGACPGCDECGLDTNCTEQERQCAEEGGFSKSDCDSCGSRLGGNRYPAHGFIKILVGSRQSERLVESRIHMNICADCLLYHGAGQEPEEWRAI